MVFVHGKMKKSYLLFFEILNILFNKFSREINRFIFA